MHVQNPHEEHAIPTIHMALLRPSSLLQLSEGVVRALITYAYSVQHGLSALFRDAFGATGVVPQEDAS